MRLDDRITISTPEGVDLEITLAGLGSRAIAGLIDLTIEACILVGLAVIYGVGFDSAGGFVEALFVIAVFLVLFGYFVLFEVLNHGRTPGKAAVGLRVLRTDGGPVTFMPSAVRNLIRLVDGWDLLTLVLCPVGVIAVISTAQNQRLGDLAAGTVVARERFVQPRGIMRSTASFGDAGGVSWDVSAITPDELITVRRFLERRPSLDPHARIHLAGELADRLRPKVSGADPSWPPEAFLEALAIAKTGRA